MKAHAKPSLSVAFAVPSVPLRWLIIALGAAICTASRAPLAAEVAIVAVDVVAVAEGYRASELRGADVVNSQNEEVGELDDLIVGKDRVLFAIIEVGGFLGLGERLIAVPYSSLQIQDGGRRILLPGATRQQVRGMPEFKYRSGNAPRKRE